MVNATGLQIAWDECHGQLRQALSMSRGLEFWEAAPQMAIGIPLGIGAVELALWLGWIDG